MAQAIFSLGTAPSTPSASKATIYFKTDKKPYYKDELGNEYPFKTGAEESFSDAVFYVFDDADNTKIFKFQASGITTGTTRTFTVPNYDGTLATQAGTEVFTNKRVTNRVQTLADSTTFAADGDSYDMVKQDNTQAVGTLTMSAPTGTPTDFQSLVFRLKSTNVQTFSWDAAFVGSAQLSLPATSSGGSLSDYMLFRWSAGVSKWRLLAVNFGF